MKRKGKPAKPQHAFGTAETADRLGISNTWLRQLADEGKLPRTGYRTTVRYPWPETRDRYNAYVQQQALAEFVAEVRRETDQAVSFRPCRHSPTTQRAPMSWWHSPPRRGVSAGLLTKVETTE